MRHLLVTGGTGFIGGAVLAALYRTSLWHRTLIMVRADTTAAAHKRVLESLRRFVPDVSANAIMRDQIVVADLRDVRALTTHPKVGQVSHVLHCAAVTSFADHPRIRSVNVEASLDFAKTICKLTRLDRFVNVGTAWCVGLHNDALILEGADIQSKEHIVPYTSSKLEFEREVRRQLPMLPFVTARPSIVVGHTRLGTAPSASIYWVFRAAHILRRFTCALDDRIDVVPVDWVAEALLAICSKPHLAHDMYHLSAGTTSYSTTQLLDQAISGALSDGRHSEPYRRVSLECLRDAVIERRDKLGEAKPRLLTKALDIYGRFAESGVLFDNRRTLNEGIAAPPPFHTYAGLCARTALAGSIAEQMADDFK